MGAMREVQTLEFARRVRKIREGPGLSQSRIGTQTTRCLIAPGKLNETPFHNGGMTEIATGEAREHFALLRRYPFYRIYVACADGRIAGTYALIVLHNLAQRGAPAGVVEDVAVLPEFGAAASAAP